ncbi:MAG: hypothetical protein JO191_07890, partial [Mycobacteriaceae bacterium]|nr:hypothetical protein [Mycobacteriaceae bacterium]
MRSHHRTFATGGVAAVVLASGITISLTAVTAGVIPALAAPTTTTTYAPAPTHEPATNPPATT